MLLLQSGAEVQYDSAAAGALTASAEQRRKRAAERAAKKSKGGHGGGGDKEEDEDADSVEDGPEPVDDLDMLRLCLRSNGRVWRTRGHKRTHARRLTWGRRHSPSRTRSPGC